MSSPTRDTVHAYYQAWAAQNKDEVRTLLADELTFISPQDRYEGADAFLDCCWQYSKGLTGVSFLHEIYDGDRAFVILIWSMADGKAFAGAEYVRVKDSSMAEILVVNNDPKFTEMVK